MKKILSILLIASLLVTPSFASQKITIRKLGGLNTRISEYEIQDNESPDLSNFEFDKAGSLTERNLFKRYNSTSIGNYSIKDIFKFYKSTDVGYLVCSTGSMLYTATSGALSDISVSSSSVTLGSKWSFESFTDGTNELVYAANNLIPLKSWNGSDSNFTEEADYPDDNCNLLKKHKARLWAAGSRNYPYRIYYSSLNNGSDWTASSGTIDLPSYEKIMALEVLSNVLYIFTRNSVYAVLGDSPNEFAIQKTRSSVGTHASKSVVVGGGLIWLLHKSGVYVFDGDTSTNVSENIQPTINLISGSYIDDSAALYDNSGKYWLSYTSINGTYNDKILVYDTVLKQWYVIDGANFSCFLKASGGADKGELFAGNSNTDGYLWQLQSSGSIEQISHAIQSQLATGVTFNTVISQVPTVENLGGFDAYTKLLIHFDGADGVTSNYYADTGQAVSLIDGAQLDTGYVILGNGSLYLDGTNDVASVPDSTDWIFGTSNFTIDCWVRFTADQRSGFVNQWVDENNWWAFYYSSSDSNLYFNCEAGGVDVVQVTTTWNPSLNTWYHVAVVRSGTTSGSWMLFIDGVKQTVGYGANHSDSASIPDMNSTLRIGAVKYDAAPIAYTAGNMDELCISTNIARNTVNFDPPSVNYAYPRSGGSLTSANLKINASGQSSLGAISWNEYLPSNTDIQFTTRSGVTDDMVEYANWETWVSSSTIMAVTGTNAASLWDSWDSTNMTVSAPSAQPRDVLYYETDDSTNPPCVQFTVKGISSKDKYAASAIPTQDISGYKFVGFWLKSPVTGDSVRMDLGEISGTSVGYATANTVEANAWEYHYFPISSFTSTDLDAVSWMKVSFTGDGSGNIILGQVAAYDFLDNEETITSTPNDYIQYKAILGSTVLTSPRLVSSNNYVVTLSYTASAGSAESSLTSYWKSKKFDLGNSYYKNWEWLEFDIKSSNPTTGNTVYLDYWIDDIEKTTLSKDIMVTGSNVKLKFYFPSGTQGKSMQFKIRDTDVDNNLVVNNAIISYQQDTGY